MLAINIHVPDIAAQRTSGIVARNVCKRFLVEEVIVTLRIHPDPGERLVRLHVRLGLPPPATPAGELDVAWADAWDEVLRDAETYRLRAIVVFDD